ncbi:NifB/NifX family molybdenum-iron cluster-binding protein [Endothiovibrio diazotrophicus]
MSVRRHLQLIDDDVELGDDALRVAFATTDRRRVDQHFGSARSFVLYDVGVDGHQMIGVSEFGSLAQDGNEAKLSDKFRLLEGVDAVYCAAVGHSAVQQLLARGIQPIRVPEATAIEELIGDLQRELAGDQPPPWLARLRRQKGESTDRFAEMEEEGWEE